MPTCCQIHSLHRFLLLLPLRRQTATRLPPHRQTATLVTPPLQTATRPAPPQSQTPPSEPRSPRALQTHAPVDRVAHHRAASAGHQTNCQTTSPALRLLRHQTTDSATSVQPHHHQTEKAVRTRQSQTAERRRHQMQIVAHQTAAPHRQTQTVVSHQKRQTHRQTQTVVPQQRRRHQTATVVRRHHHHRNQTRPRHQTTMTSAA